MSAKISKINLLGMTKKDLEDFFLSINEKKFRANQVMKWIHHFGVDDFNLMSNLSKSLQEKLKQCAVVKAPNIVSENISSYAVVVTL